jgi:hypothetical protein
VALEEEERERKLLVQEMERLRMEMEAYEMMTFSGEARQEEGLH